jgi:hypothetical protein
MSKCKVEQTYWGFTLDIRNPETGWNSGYIASGDTFDQAMTKLFQAATYYLELGREVQVSRLEQCCLHCLGVGQVRKSRLAMKPCPHCKGQPVIQSLPGFPCRIHPNVLDDRKAAHAHVP